MAAGQLTVPEREDRTLILVHLVSSRLMPHIQVVVVTARLKAGLASPKYQELAGTLQGKFVGLRQEPSFDFSAFMNGHFPDAEQLWGGGVPSSLGDSPMSPATPRPPQSGPGAARSSGSGPPQTRQTCLLSRLALRAFRFLDGLAAAGAARRTARSATCRTATPSSRACCRTRSARQDFAEHFHTLECGHRPSQTLNSADQISAPVY